jgi:uncharacterized protein (TIGR02145 family)
MITYAVLYVNGSMGQTVTDIDGNVYNTVVIGTQRWITENLKTTKLNDGTAIPLVTNGIAWNNLSTPGYCWYNNDSSTYNSYGVYYNWFAVDTGNLCPIGWHVASDTDWIDLNNYLGGSTIAGGKLKATTLWNTPNTGATNETGFTALPGGYRGGGGVFADMGNMGMWWTSSGTGFPFDAWLRGMNYNNSNLDRGTLAKYYGFSVRCINDITVGINDNKATQLHAKIYPNPSDRYVMIENKNAQKSLLRVIDIYGKVVIEKEFIKTTAIELQNKGVYVVRISNGSNIMTEKLIIQ